MRSCLIMIMLVVLGSVSTSVHAREVFHPSRVQLFVHARVDIHEDTAFLFRLLPSTNLLDGVQPITYLGVMMGVIPELSIEGYTGWNFLSDEPLFSLSSSARVGKLWAWTELDLYGFSVGGYWFAQMECEFLSWFHVGVEGEGWGNFTDDESWNHGGGPNIILRFDRFGVDMAIHIRSYDMVTRPEFLMRVNIFL
jgi:hypothetical protein